MAPRGAEVLSRHELTSCEPYSGLLLEPKRVLQAEGYGVELAVFIVLSNHLHHRIRGRCWFRRSSAARRSHCAVTLKRSVDVAVIGAALALDIVLL